VDNVPALPDGRPIPTQSKPLHIFFPRMVQLQTDFTRKVIEALKLKDDPVLAMVEIDNESSLVEAHQRGNLERSALGEYKTELERQWNAFTGPKDYLLFLADRDRHYLREMLRAVRESTDRWMPVAGTQMGYGGLLNLDTHQDLDYQDNHFYIDHYNFPNQAWDARDWRVRDSSSVGSGLATFLNMAAAREAGKPYTVSEFNQPWPNRQAAEIDPTLAAFGAFQNWDSIMHFAYEHGRPWDIQVPSGFNLNGDWTKLPNLGQSAWLFRSGAIQPGKAPVLVPVSQELRLQAAREKRVGGIAGFLAAAAGYDPAVALLHPVGLAKSDGQGLAQAAKARLASPFRSDTGELVYDRDKKLLTIQAAKAAGVFGFVGTNNKVTTGALDVELATSTRGFATILVTPLEGRPLRDSRRLLLTIPGYTLGTQPGTAPPRRQQLIPYRGAQDWWTLEPEPNSARPSGSRNGGSPPVWMEQVECFVTLRVKGRRIAVYPLDSAGARLAPLGADAVRRVKGGFRIHLQGDGQVPAPWYELVKE
jgi:hypothetical protein